MSSNLIKPFYQINGKPDVLYDQYSGYPSGIVYNGITLEIDGSIFPNSEYERDRLCLSLFRFTSFINTLPIRYDRSKVFKISGFTDYNNFKIEPCSQFYTTNGNPINIIYLEINGYPSIITK